MIASYRDWLPVSDSDPVISRGEEASTLLVAAEKLSELLHCETWIKVEGANPTGSCQGPRHDCCAQCRRRARSAGRGLRLDRQHLRVGRRVRKAGLSTIVLLPAGRIATGKLAQAIVHGAKVVQIDGNFDDCLELARKLAHEYPVALVNSVNPNRIEGQKTAAFEVIDELGDAPTYM